MELNVQSIWNVDCGVWGSLRLLWAEHKFNCGMYNRFKEGREDVNDDARSGRLSMSTTDENIEAVQKRILGNRGITIERERLLMAYRSAHAKQFLRMF